MTPRHVTRAIQRRSDGLPALWTSQEIAACTGGYVERDVGIYGIAIDSREVRTGDVFVCLQGTTQNGHDFLAQAAERGAAACLVCEERIDSCRKEAALGVATGTARGLGHTLGYGPELIRVHSPLRALDDMARQARARTRARVVAVTGSYGKTTFTQGLALALGPRVHVTAGNENNELGARLTLARLAADQAFAVLECAMRKPRDLADLSQLVRPHVAVITGIGPAHLEFFQDTAGIARAKAELFLSMEAGGQVVINRDSEHYELMAGEARCCGVKTIISYGFHPEAGTRITSCERGDDGRQQVEITSGTDKLSLDLADIGEHWAQNAAGIMAATRALDQMRSHVVDSLREWMPTEGRGGLVDLRAGPSASGAFGHRIQVIDDSYNASPYAMRALFARLANWPTKQRKILIVADMLELGVKSKALHETLVEPICEARPAILLLLGPLMGALADRIANRLGAGCDVESLPSAEAALAYLLDGGLLNGGADDVIAIKGSRAFGLESIIKGLRHAFDPHVPCFSSHPIHHTTTTSQPNAQAAQSEQPSTHPHLRGQA